jgi:hypothetical protein
MYLPFSQASQVFGTHSRITMTVGLCFFPLEVLTLSIKIYIGRVSELNTEF